MTDITSPKSLDRIADKAEPVDDLIKELLAHWRYDLDARKPGPAYSENGQLASTDVDLACLVSSLAERKAVVQLPRYLAGNTGGKSGSSLKSGGVRTGQLLRLQSNKEFFSFSVLINDQNMIDPSSGKQVEAIRSFYLVGKDGRWHPGWETLEFDPNAKENDFLKKIDVNSLGSLAFKNFVHPGRRTAFYGSYYFLTRASISRLEDEASELRKVIKDIKAKLPKDTKTSKESFSKDNSEKSWNTKTLDVPVMEVEADMPWRNTFDFSGLGLSELEARLRTIDNEFLPALRFHARATELAFYKSNGEKAGIPSFVKGSWHDQTFGRTTWRTLDKAAGMKLRYRIRAKSIEVPVR